MLDVILVAAFLIAYRRQEEEWEDQDQYEEEWEEWDDDPSDN